MSRAKFKVVDGSNLKPLDDNTVYKTWINSASWLGPETYVARSRFVMAFASMLERFNHTPMLVSGAEHTGIKANMANLGLNPENRRRMGINPAELEFDRLNPPPMLADKYRETWFEVFAQEINWLHVADTFTALHYVSLLGFMRELNNYDAFTEKRATVLDLHETNLGFNARGARKLGVKVGGTVENRGGLD